MNDQEHGKTEILIIRRSHNDDHAHHGGAWKIAYADFVTAMMAFFLVMWLINSANEATRARVASYFNPIKMTDPSPTGRGLSESMTPKSGDKKAPKEAKEDKAAKTNETAGVASGSGTATQVSDGKSEDSLMRDPYKMIDNASQDGAVVSGKAVEIISQSAGDPFDPQAWSALREGKRSSEAVIAESRDTSPMKEQKPQDGAQAKNDAKAKENVTPSTSIDKGETSVKASNASSATNGTSVDNTVEASRSIDATVAKVHDEILQSIQTAGAAADIGLKVSMTSEGLLIVLSDKAGRGMFEVGSAAPSSALVKVVEGVGKVLESQSGRVVVRGHTDERLFKRLKFDNWQLSTARAHLASYMLIRGGFDESRLWKIEGYGSSDLQNKQDPLADENRRVEILLRR